MLALYAPLLVAAASGLAYVAMKHPVIYQRLFGKVYFLSGVIFLVLVVWSGAISLAHTTLLPFISPENSTPAAAAIDSISIPTPWLLLANLIVAAYLFFLAWFSRQVEQDRHANEHET
jgi:hypothetical protein